jgi:hypothetical protein
MFRTMIPLSNERLLTDSEFRRLREGSYEDKVARIRDAVLAQASEHFVEGVDIEVLSTYPDRVVLSAAGQFYEAKLETTNLGEYRLVGVEPAGVESYDADSLSQYVQKEASVAVDLFLKGSQKQALEHMFSMVPYVDSESAVTPDMRISAVAAELDKASSWKSTLEQRFGEMSGLAQELLGESLQLEEQEPKFRMLHEGADREKLNTYASLVSEDLDTVLARMESLWEDASEAREIANSAVVLEDSPEVLSVYSSFVSDLVDDLQALGVVTDSARVQIENRVEAQAKLHDMLIERLRPYEMGTRFAVAVAQRLDEAK